MKRLAAGIALAFVVSHGAGLASTQGESLLADLPDEILESVRASAAVTDEPADLLARVFAAVPPYHFDAGLVGVDTDHRWFQTLPPDVPGAPMLELRRWPGDTVLALYALEGADTAEAGPSMAGAVLSAVPGEGAGGRRFEGTLATPLGPRPVAWLEVAAPAAQRRLGALLAPGDAGLGGDAVPALVQELFAVVGRIEMRSEAWALQGGIPAGTRLVPPDLDAPPEDADEERDPWQVVEGAAYTLGLPPGVRARRLDQGVSAPRALPGAALWLRGQFVDRRGVKVVIGDAARAGYLAFPASIDRAWTTGVSPPVGAPRAKRIASEDFTVACEQTGADGARGERWSEPGFGGDWLVFRLVIKGAGIELGLPVVSGRQSEALFWIPTTFRGKGQSPAPPPVDPAERFGIVFKEFTKLDRKRHPGCGGYLVLPGVRFELPSGWSPVTTLRSAEGFPVVLFDAQRRRVGQIVRVPPGNERSGEPEKEEWTLVRMRGARGAGSLYRRADGARLHVGADGKRTLLVPGERIAGGTEWQRLVESATLLRPEPRKASREEATADR